MTRRKFSRYMVAIGAGTHVKFARLSDSERCAHFLGILSIAAQAPIRGCLLVGEQEAGAAEIAREAGVSKRVASSTLTKLKEIGVLTRDDDLHCWVVHDWSDVNPEPKEDRTNAERQARYRARRAKSNGSGNAWHNAVTLRRVTPAVTPPEVEVRKKGTNVPFQAPVVYLHSRFRDAFLVEGQSGARPGFGAA